MTQKFYFIPEDWRLSAKLQKWTKDLGVSDKDIIEQREADSMKLMNSYRTAKLENRL